MHLADGYYEIIGTVKDDLTVKALTSIELGPKLGELTASWSHICCINSANGIDMKAVQAVVFANSSKGTGVLS
jgi:replication factor A3